MTGAIMAYAPVSAAVATPESGPLVDHRFGNVYNFAIADGANTGMRKFDAWPNGKELLSRNIADLGVAGVYTPQVILYNTQLIGYVAGASNGGAIRMHRATDLAYIKGFGTADSSFTNNTIHIANPTSLCAITAANGRGDFILANTQNDKHLNLIDTFALRNTPLTDVDEDFALVGAIPGGGGTTAFVLGYWTDTTKALGLYTVTVANGLAKKGTVTPTQVDATWTNFVSVYGISVDQIDGHPIVAMSTTDAVTHRAYIVKLNKTNGSVIWAVPVADNPGGIAYAREDMGRNLITKGKLLYIGLASDTFFTINTQAGTVVQSVFSHGATDALHASQCSEDVSESVYFFGAWSEGTTHPAYLGYYCLTLGHTSGSSLTWRYFPNTATPVVPTPGIAAQSRRRAWSFVMDGHVFYVLDLGAQGTYCYDDTTGFWSRFITQNFDGWNLVNGTMWGQRIVGGDYASPDIWEMQPGALMDNGSVDIVHVVTGALAKRTRVFSSVEAVRLNVAIGQLDDFVSATVLLSFSDDQGQTWTDADTYTLTEGDTSAELAWRSLGSFAAPGRIFRVTDVGGFIRIDGCDANIDNFDEDSNAATKEG